MNKGLIAGLVLGSVTLITGFVGYGSMMGHNEAGQKHFVQTYLGDQKTVTEGGPFWYGNGSKIPYMNSLRTIKTPQGRACNYSNNDGFIVQYGDGGKGAICAQLDSQLPAGDIFVKLHNKYRSEDGVRMKLLDPNFRSLFTTTAELFTSTEAYETKRSQIGAALQDQLLNGPYITTTEDREIVTGVGADGQEITQTKSFSIIKLDSDNNKMHQTNPFAQWDMTDITVTVTGFDFEDKTMTQIQNRRDAANRGETAQAEAKAAYWEGKKAVAEGERKRIVAQAAAEVKNAPAIADANREAALAVINAKRIADEARELTLAANETLLQKTAEALSAVQEAKVITTLANAEAYKLDAMQKAGKLFKEIEAETIRNADRSDAMANMNVPTNLTILGGGKGEGNTSESAVLQLMVVEKLNQLNVKSSANK